MVIQPIDRHVGLGGGKIQRSRAAAPLLRPRNQNYLASELHVQLP